MIDEHQKREQAKRDAVTVGQIRARKLRLLEDQIVQLNGLIKDGYHKRHAAEAFLKDNIGNTLTELDNINSLASIEVIFPTEKK